MDSFITTFHIDWKIIIAQVINFAVIFVVLYFLALKPLKKLMAARSEEIRTGLADAKTNATLLADTRKEYNDVLAQARTEAHELFQEGKRDAESKKAEMLASAQADVDAMIANGKKTLEAEKAKMVEEAKKEIVSLVVRATEKLLAETDDKAHTEGEIKKIKKA